MPAYRGCRGVVSVGLTPTVVGEVTAFDFTETAQEIDTTSMNGTCTASSQAGTVKTTGSVTMNWDYTDAGQDLIVIGEFIALEISPDGTTNPAPLFAGVALILSKGATSEVNGIVGATFSYTIDGPWLETIHP